jgi:hydroxymethylpyrimidine pyrophosphatase-like HAD family hydrolase
MIPFPLDPARQRELLAEVGFVATDVDGTLTTAGVLTAAVVEAIGALAALDVEVLPVSGRAAGEVLGLVRYLPGVRRGIAENGQVLVEADRALTWLAAPPDRAAIEAVAREIAAGQGDPLVLAPDWFCRVGDVAFERAGRPDSAIAPLAEAASQRGLHVVWSSVHIHFSASPPDKGAALMKVLDSIGIARRSVLTMGDAPNDVGLFVHGRFGPSVGTHDVRAHSAYMTSVPAFVCAEREGAAFLTVARALLSSRGA